MIFNLKFFPQVFSAITVENIREGKTFMQEKKEGKFGKANELSLVGKQAKFLLEKL